MLIPVEGNPGLFRDTQSGAIVNKNKSGYQAYISKRDRLNENKKKVETLEEKVETLSDDIGEIKDLLKQILDK